MTAVYDDSFGDDDNDDRVTDEEEERGDWIPIPVDGPQVFKKVRVRVSTWAKLFEALKKLGFGK